MTIKKIAFFLMCILSIFLFAPTSSYATHPKTTNENQTNTSHHDIKEKGTLVVGVDIPYGVMEFYDDSGTLTGIDIQLANEIASHIGVSMEVKAMPFSELFSSLKANEVDLVISAVTITEERQKEMLFSVPYLNAGMSIAVHKDNVDVKSIQDIGSKRVGVLKGTVGEDLALKSDFIDSSLVISYQNNEQRLQDLLDGKVDVVIVHFIVKKHDSVKIVGDPLSESYYGVVANLNDNDLMKEVNTTLRGLKRQGKLEQIINKFLDGS